MSEATSRSFKVEGTKNVPDEKSDKKVSHNPEVTEKATRRRLSREYKERIAIEARQCQRPGEIGALLRREGLLNTTLVRWRRQRQENALNPRKINGKVTPAQEIKRLKRENERLAEKLRQAELIIDVQSLLRRICGWTS